MIAICLFRKGIDPAWEDEKNKYGGDFSATKRKCFKDELKTFWDKLIFAVIGSSWEYSEHVRRRYLYVDNGTKSC